MKKKILILSKYIFIFLLLLFFFYFINYSNFFYGDGIIYYGFSHAIRMGEIPYLDFNTISTPLYSFIMSIGLFIIDNYIVYVIEHVILIFILFLFLEKLIGKKSYIVLLSFFLFNAHAVNTTYNFFVSFLIIVLIYLEKNHNNKDYLIGLIIGSIILSKHTIGIFFMFPTLLFYFKNLKKVVIRYLGVFTPCLIFLFYLIVNDAFFNFFDLCFLGLFDFAGNSGRSILYFCLSVILLLFSIFCNIRSKNRDINNYYFVLSFLFLVPLFDRYHFASYFPFFILFIMYNFSDLIDKRKIIILLYAFFCAMYIFVAEILVIINNTNFVITRKFSYLNTMVLDKKLYNNFLIVNDYIKKWDNPIIISASTMCFNVVNNNEINYFSVFNNGNFGYNGIDKMIKKINSEHGKYILVDYNYFAVERKAYRQLPYEIGDYIMNNFELVDETAYFKVYYIK